MEKQKIKSNKAMSMADIIIAIFILTLFVGVIGSLYYQILLNSNLVRMNAFAVYYSIKIAENIDKMAYEKVTNDLNTTVKSDYAIPDDYQIQIQVNPYQKEDSTQEKDIIKIVTIKITYQCLNETRDYEIKKLKVKEI